MCYTGPASNDSASMRALVAQLLMELAGDEASNPPLDNGKTPPCATQVPTPPSAASSAAAPSSSVVFVTTSPIHGQAFETELPSAGEGPRPTIAQLQFEAFVRRAGCGTNLDLRQRRRSLELLPGDQGR